MRRLVTGHNAAGKAVFVADGEPPFQVAHEAGGMRIARLWSTEGVPALPAAGDSSAVRQQFFPAPGGTRFMVVHIPPASDLEKAAQAGKDVEKASLKFMEQLPGLGEHMEPETPGMHTSQTIDYGIIMAGQVDLELDDGVKKRLKAGDFYIQNGTRHAWHNPGPEVCVLVAAVIGANKGG